jgi:long-chain acyl-CoA synthetase
VVPIFLKDIIKCLKKLQLKSIEMDGFILVILVNGSLTVLSESSIVKKNIFKLAQGEYVAAEFLETVYLRSEFVASIFVYGDSLKNYLVAILVVDMDSVGPAAVNLGIKGTPDEICAHPKIRAMIFDSLMKIGSDANLKGFEKVRNIYVDHQPWTIDNDLLTPTMKLKRQSAQKYYEKIIDQLYAEPRLDVKKSRL